MLSNLVILNNILSLLHRAGQLNVRPKTYGYAYIFGVQPVGFRMKTPLVQHIRNPTDIYERITPLPLKLKRAPSLCSSDALSKRVEKNEPLRRYLAYHIRVRFHRDYSPYFP